MSASTKKTSASASAKPSKPPSAAKAPAKTSTAKTPAKMIPAKVPAKRVPAKTPALKKNSRELMLARVEAVRLEQRNQGHFDCFGRASDGYCDQGDCSYHAECLSVSRMMHSL